MSVKGLGPLDWRIPIVTPDGRPTSEFQRRWANQISNNNEIGGITLGLGPPPAIPAPEDGAQYADTSTNPYTIYIASGGTWHLTGSPTVTGANPTATASDVAVNGSANTFMRSDAAPAIQKASSSQFGIVKVDGTTITESGGVISAIGGGGAVSVEQNGTEIVASATTLNFIGATVSDAGGGQANITLSGGGGGVPTIVQSKAIDLSNMSSGITLDAAPASGNLLIAIMFNATTTAPPAVTSGWTNLNNNSQLPDSTVCYKVAGGSETATQNPTTTTDGGAIILFEVTGFIAVSPSLTTVTATGASVDFSQNNEYLPTSSGLGIAYAGRRTQESATWSGSFITDIGIAGDPSTTGGTGVSISTGIANVPQFSSLSATSLWPTSVATRTGFILVA